MGYAQVRRTIDARMELSTGEIALVNERFDAPIDVRGETNGRHHLQLSMMPSVGAARSRFGDRGRTGRFAPLGNLFLLPAQSTVDILGSCTQQRALVCRFDPVEAADWLGADFEWTGRRLARALDIASGEIQRQLYRVAAELEAPGFASRKLIEALMAQVCVELGRILRQPSEGVAAGGLAPQRMRLVEAEIARDPGGVSVARLAALCGLSTRQLSRAFHETRGETLATSIAAARIRHACERLRDGASVKQAAAASGYAAPSNFATAFRREVGCSPKEYRGRAISFGRSH